MVEGGAERWHVRLGSLEGPLRADREVGWRRPVCNPCSGAPGVHRGEEGAPPGWGVHQKGLFEHSYKALEG